LNKNIRGDEKRYTHTRGEGTVINYIIIDREARDKIERMEIGNKVDSDPIVAWIRGRIKRESGRERDYRGARV